MVLHYECRGEARFILPPFINFFWPTVWVSKAEYLSTNVMNAYLPSQFSWVRKGREMNYFGLLACMSNTIRYVRRKCLKRS